MAVVILLGLSRSSRWPTESVDSSRNEHSRRCDSSPVCSVRWRQRMSTEVSPRHLCSQVCPSHRDDLLETYPSFRLIQHAKYLLTQTEEHLCLRIMHSLKSMVKSHHDFDTMVREALTSSKIHRLPVCLGAKSSLEITSTIFCWWQTVFEITPSTAERYEWEKQIVGLAEKNVRRFESTFRHSLVIVRLI